MKTFIKRALATATLLAGAISAHAAVIYTFNTTAVDKFGSGPYGTVTLTDTGANIDVSVVLRSDMNFVNTGGPHSVFSFNVLGAVSTDVTNVMFNGFTSALYSVVAPGENQPFGTNFSLMIDCTAKPACDNGAGGQIPDPLTFTVLNTEYTDFGFFATGTTAYFAADVICTGSTLSGCNGQTGAIGVSGRGVSDGSPPPTGTLPEPGSLALAALAILGAGFAGRRKI